MESDKNGRTCHNGGRVLGVKLVAITADGREMPLEMYRPDPLVLDPTTKVGRGLCSATACEERAVYLARRPRLWGLCTVHAQVYESGNGYWTPGMPYPEIEEGP